MSQKIRKTTMITCEGSVTEPNYFNGIARLTNEAAGRLRVIIRPKPPLQKEEEKKAAEAELERAIAAGEIERSNRKRRQPLPAKKEPETIEIPEGFTAQPVNYVWQAQNELKIHEEAWAVFDLDGHAKQKTAFDLAEQEVLGKKVDIAFSSISFETWILMDFEHCATVFSKSQCRTQKELHDCGQGVHTKDCEGADCTTGYMKTKGYLPKRADVKHTSYESIKGKTFTAIENSLLLRKGLGNPVDCYNYNPITTVDRLTFKLLYIDDDYKWIGLSNLLGYHLSYSRTGASILTIKILNDTGTSIVIHPSSYHLCNLKNEKMILFERKVLADGEHMAIELNLRELTDFDPKLLVLKNEDSTSSIIELQCLV